MERRKHREVKRAPFIDCHLLLQALLHSKHVPLSLPITRSKINEKYKGGRRRKTTLNYSKLQHGMKTTPKTLHISKLKNPGGFYRHQGNRGPGDKPWPKTRCAPRPYGRGNAAWASFSRPLGGRARRFEPRAVLLVPCQILFPVLVSGP